MARTLSSLRLLPVRQREDVASQTPACPRIACTDPEGGPSPSPRVDAQGQVVTPAATRVRGGGLGLGFALGLAEAMPKRLDFGFPQEPEFAPAGACHDAGVDELAQPLGAVAQVLGRHRKQYQPVLPVHATSIWPYAKFYTPWTWRNTKYSAIIGEMPNMGGPRVRYGLHEIDWLAEFNGQRPTSERLRVAYKRVLARIWETMTKVEQSVIWDDRRTFQANFKRRCDKPLSENPMEHQGSEAWFSTWSGWTTLVGPRPNVSPVLDALLNEWSAQHPDLPSAKPVRGRIGHTGLRFKVLTRDQFRCRYCGRSAPEVVLHVDHIYPRSKGGEDSLENLVAACRECNLGKRDVLLPALQESPS